MLDAAIHGGQTSSSLLSAITLFHFIPMFFPGMSSFSSAVCVCVCFERRSARTQATRHPWQHNPQAGHVNGKVPFGEHEARRRAQPPPRAP